MSLIIPRTEIFQGQGLTCISRVIGNNGQAIVRADIQSIACKVISVTGGGTTAATPAIVVASVVFNSLQTGDPRWTGDTTGYNFLHVIPASAFATPQADYKIQYVFTPATGEPFAIGFAAKTSRIF